MAGDWMKIEHCTPDKPEILAIAARIGTHPDHAFGTCFRMWRWFDLHTQNGNAPGVTTALLNQLLGVTGFAEAALATGWLEACEIEGKQSLRLPNFDRHTGQTAKHRALTAKRVASHKRKGNGESNAKGNDASVSVALPREEKRREEKSNTPKAPKGDLVLPELPQGINTPEFRNCLENWLAYKGKRYKPQGLAALLSRAATLVRQHGQQAVIEQIQRAMANGWQGWDQPGAFNKQAVEKAKKKINYLTKSDQERAERERQNIA